MKKLILILMIVTNQGFAQNDCACNIKNLVTVNQNLEDLTSEDIGLLLCTFDEACKNNSEFSAFSNEVLFEVMGRRPDILIQEMADNDNLEFELILSKLENPIHDGFDLERIINKVSAIQEHEKIKEQILQSLNVAMSK